jgi:cation:H+ antiporter
MSAESVIWLQFALCAALIGVAGYQLSRYADAIAQRTGLSGSWIGMTLLAIVTSLPERDHTKVEASEVDTSLPSLRGAITRFALAAAVVASAGIWLPELAVTLSALRMGALDMAIGNLLGSNLFNVLIIAIDDLFYRPGSLLAAVSPVHAVTVGSAITMTGLAMVGLFFRPGGRVLRAISWISLGLMAMYLLNTYVLYLYGE